VSAGAVRLAQPKLTEENKVEATGELLKGIRDLNTELIKVLTAFDERLHKLEP
jgi:hypothetical protein